MVPRYAYVPTYLPITIVIDFEVEHEITLQSKPSDTIAC